MAQSSNSLLDLSAHTKRNSTVPSNTRYRCIAKGSNRSHFHLLYIYIYITLIYYIDVYIYGWFGVLTEDKKFSINYLIDTTRLYKQKTSAATRPSQGFEILVLASFRSHYSGVLITYGTATRNCSTEFTFVTELNSFQPVPNDTISDWRTNNVSKIVLPRFLTLKELLVYIHIYISL